MLKYMARSVKLALFLILNGVWFAEPQRWIPSAILYFCGVLCLLLIGLWEMRRGVPSYTILAYAFAWPWAVWKGIYTRVLVVAHIWARILYRTWQEIKTI